MMSVVFVLIVLVLRLVLVALSIRYIIYNILIYMRIDIHIDILRYTLYLQLAGHKIVCPFVRLWPFVLTPLPS
jgi:hypothetical protein